MYGSLIVLIDDYLDKKSTSEPFIRGEPIPSGMKDPSTMCFSVGNRYRGRIDFERMMILILCAITHGDEGLKSTDCTPDAVKGIEF